MSIPSWGLRTLSVSDEREGIAVLEHGARTTPW